MLPRFLLFILTVCAASVYAKPVIVSTKVAECEWKNNIIEFRIKGRYPQKVLIQPYFTNGVDIRNAKVEFFNGYRPGFTLRGKNCSLAFVLSQHFPTLRISVPRNAGFKVLTDTEALILPDLRVEDTILEPGKTAYDVPGFLPFFMGLQKGENWTLSCAAERGSSDIRISADLKTWEFSPKPLEEYTLFVHSFPKVWHRLKEKLDYNIRKPIAWKPPFKARFNFAFPIAADFIDVNNQFHNVWSASEMGKKNRPINVSCGDFMINPKNFTSWSSGYFGTYPYPAYWRADGIIEASYPVHVGQKRIYDPNRPVFIYTYDSGAYNKKYGFPVNALALDVRNEFTVLNQTGSVGISPATCDITSRVIEKIFYRSEARSKKDEISKNMERMQLFVEGVRSRIGNYRSWADGMIRYCRNEAKQDPAVAKELEPLLKTLQLIEAHYVKALPAMKTPDDAYALQKQLLADIDNKAYDDEKLEELAKAFGRATRTIGGAQDSCVAYCHYAVKRLCQQSLMAYMTSKNPTVKKIVARLIDSCMEILNYHFHHEGR